LIAWGRDTLLAAGVGPAEASLDARLLAQHPLGWSTATLLTSGGAQVPPGLYERYCLNVQRRTQREPLAYITGIKEFWNLDFEVSRAVLIPRPETEVLVETLLERLPASRGPAAIADVCTGSGCVAISIASERPDVHLTATDISDEALQTAARNAERHRVRGRISLVRADLMNGLSGPFDAIVANPPYVRTIDRPGLQAEVKDFEPAVALFGGTDGLAVIRSLIEQSAARLTAAGVLLFEFGHGQEEDVRKLISSSRELRMVNVRPDFQGIARVAIVERLDSSARNRSGQGL
jgi:release factor glutamine methyltransferase